MTKSSVQSLFVDRSGIERDELVAIRVSVQGTIASIFALLNILSSDSVDNGKPLRRSFNVMVSRSLTSDC